MNFKIVTDYKKVHIPIKRKLELIRHLTNPDFEQLMNF
jgi:hypothetical protein